MEEMISAEHLRFAYPGLDNTPGVTVFEDLDLQIETGSFVAVLGTNGCGKSTLAKHFNAILLPTGGKLYVCGMDTSAEDRLMAIRRTVGMVFQNPDNQIVANVVEEDVAFGPENLGIASPEIRRRVDQALHQVGMYEYREMDTVQKLNREKKITIVLITHHMEEAAQAQRVIVLNKGKIAADGTPREVFCQTELLHRIGLAAPDTVELCYALNQKGAGLPLDAIGPEECAQALYSWVKA